MHLQPLRFAALTAVLAFPLAACDTVTNPRTTDLEVRLSSQVGATASAALAPSFFFAAVQGAPGMGPVSLEDVESILVEITDVLVLPSGGEDSENGGGWVSLENLPVDPIELMTLGTVATLGTLPADAGIATIAAVRLVFGESKITVEGEDPASLFIPSGKVTIATPGLAASGTTLDLTFLQNASVKKVIRTGIGYLMPPVILPAGQPEPEDELEAEVA